MRQKMIDRGAVVVDDTDVDECVQWNGAGEMLELMSLAMKPIHSEVVVCWLLRQARPCPKLCLMTSGFRLKPTAIAILAVCLNGDVLGFASSESLQQVNEPVGHQWVIL
jgi:hypothetical protein